MEQPLGAWHGYPPSRRHTILRARTPQSSNLAGPDVVGDEQAGPRHREKPNRWRELVRLQRHRAEACPVQHPGLAHGGRPEDEMRVPAVPPGVSLGPPLLGSAVRRARAVHDAVSDDGTQPLELIALARQGGYSAQASLADPPVFVAGLREVGLDRRRKPEEREPHGEPRGGDPELAGEVGAVLRLARLEPAGPLAGDLGNAPVRAGKLDDRGGPGGGGNRITGVRAPATRAASPSARLRTRPPAAWAGPWRRPRRATCRA